MYDVLIVGGGPAGLSATLALGRGRRRVLLCDAGPRRNAAAEQMHNFLTRDGTPPTELRRLARVELAQYPSVEFRDESVRSITGAQDDFTVHFERGEVKARRILLATGMVDLPGDIPGLREIWGHSAFQCPYCHGWERRDGAWAYLATNVEMAAFAMLLGGWTNDVTLLTNGGFEVTPQLREQLERAAVKLDERRVAKFETDGAEVHAVVFADGARRPIDSLFHHPPQRQVALVASLGLTLTKDGYVQVDERGKTSRAGIVAAGDLTTHVQGAIIAANAGMLAAAALNFDLALSARPTAA